VNEANKDLNFTLLPLQLLANQPKATSRSSIKKCCPLYQNYKIEMGKRFCGNSSLEFNVSPIRAKFYENCIEDEESDVTIDIKIENSCKKYVAK
jgi:hypothetical protein